MPQLFVIKKDSRIFRSMNKLKKLEVKSVTHHRRIRCPQALRMKKLQIKSSFYNNFNRINNKLRK